ncbi:Phosphatidylglycerol/phosphatidylinositol transfer protein [Tolypocladium ophioglossoides CBS 100239]|uniref:Phosphatidylglycerol/phosphatidylinositol transfer protein n=1 Tax=Tolypocladium ophioglossoides (strain CBS 100239) TaxID=1163406 RepID=A0A0L0N176_TOLOC|nr:Phosphatidylglycerol/phosphatidylinositol transfer protein [Tolypocladium ophioglossoides CBS 100239]
MRFSVACLSACLAPAAALSVFNGNAPDATANLGLRIPGESPLELCDGEHGDDIVEIERVDLMPNPPAAGQELVIKAHGTVKKTIEEGAYVQLSVKYGLIRLINTKADLCEQIGNVDLKCPVKAGDMKITKKVDLPNEIPPVCDPLPLRKGCMLIPHQGRYTVQADVYTADDEHITCLTATVTFNMAVNGFFSNEL